MQLAVMTKMSINSKVAAEHFRFMIEIHLKKWTPEISRLERSYGDVQLISQLRVLKALRLFNNIQRIDAIKKVITFLIFYISYFLYQRIVARFFQHAFIKFV